MGGSPQSATGSWRSHQRCIQQPHPCSGCRPLEQRRLCLRRRRVLQRVVMCKPPMGPVLDCGAVVSRPGGGGSSRAPTADAPGAAALTPQRTEASLGGVMAQVPRGFDHVVRGRAIAPHEEMHTWRRPSLSRLLSHMTSAMPAKPSQKFLTFSFGPARKRLSTSVLTV